ncbi:carbohydrate ABC transporter permease [Paenibacillus sp. 19GGS1-52]|uniref:carbohydrate ABC transporter permease n=1 Tax=Paenibacillus sp. 19GGS1-52 TaxID=2758563 RepID=UPI001EFB70A0|nr:carbohydrate ABC transporter permease [Paenibacillus sp. 19GGS1-52]ULO06620.1 carbohydrate ABC transporter permease [Paenibacillus sp. 19GGS1-52]
MRTKRTNWLATCFLIAGSVFLLFPLYMTFMLSIKNNKEIADSILAFPKVWRWENFITAAEKVNYWQKFRNSSIITVLTVTFTLFTNSFVAYAIKKKFDHKFFKGLYFYFISAMFVPFPIIMLPVVKLTARLGLDNLYGLILLYIVYGLSFNVLLYVGYLRSLPQELDEAAIVDGASVWQTFWKIIFPLLAPINATVAIITTVWAWNDFLLPLIMLDQESQTTLPLAQFIFQSKFGQDTNLAFASYLMAMAPLLIVYILAQKWIISGVTRGAVK